LLFDGMRFPPADLNTAVSNEPAPPPRSIPAGSAVAAPVGEHLLVALLSERIEALAALQLHC
jgi:hypothetical protein